MRLVLALLLALVVACGGPEPVTYSVSGLVMAGPTCGVVSNPPDPNCADRPVRGAVLLFVADNGKEIEAATGADGAFEIELPTGNYSVEPQPVDGLMGTAPPFMIRVDETSLELGTISYDTGIR